MIKTEQIVTTRAASPSTWVLAWRRFHRHKLAMASLGVILLVLLMALCAPWLAPYDPTAQPTGPALGNHYFQGPSPEHPFGTDELGRDVLARIIYGSRISLLVGFVAALSSVGLGTMLGTLAGYFSGQSVCLYIGPLQRELGWGTRQSLCGALEQRGGSVGSAHTLFSLLGWGVAWMWQVVRWGCFYLALACVAWLGWMLAEPAVPQALSGTRSVDGLLPVLALGLIWVVVVAGAVWGLWGELRLDLDILISRWIDLMLTIPALPLLLVLSTFLRDPHVLIGQWAQQAVGDAASVLIIICVIVAFGWMTSARLVRGTMLSLREHEFALAARAVGASEARIMVRHLLPNALAPIIVEATLQVGEALLTEAALSFLGFGIQPPVATWGNMLTNAQQYLFRAPWLALTPGCMILITVLAFNYFGDGLRDALDPRSQL